MSLKDLLYDETIKTRTENNALAYETTKSFVLDLFGIGGAGRNLDEAQLYQKISQALSEDLELGIRCVLFLGDIRGGQGERRLFKTALKYLVQTQPKKLVERILENVPKYTRWDYLWDFLGNDKYGDFILTMIKQELASKETSLIYKWLPSVSTHGKNSKPNTVAQYIYTKLEMNQEQYRKMLSKGRKELQVVEQQMSAKQWKEIDFSRVPSKASLIYKDAFMRHDEERYNDYIGKVLSGEAKINSGVLYPHEIVYKAFREGQVDTLEALWKNLPNYIQDEGKIVLPLIDVSGSMFTPISNNSNIEAVHVSIGMGLYMAERLTGEFKDHFLTFSEEPKLVKVVGNTLYQRIVSVRGSNWGYNTNLIKAFDVILQKAVENNLKKEELPNTIVVFTDMEFDSASRYDTTPFNQIKASYQRFGYELPQVVFWNLNARNIQFPVKQNEKGVILVSGYSPTTLKYVLNGELKTPYELMVEVLNQERYNIFK